MVVRYIPEAGDIVWVDFSPTKGHEQSGKRPAVVITERVFAKASTICTVCPITSKSKGYSNEVKVSVGNINGVILIDQHKSVDVCARKLTKVARVDMRTLSDVRERIGIIFGITK